MNKSLMPHLFLRLHQKNLDACWVKKKISITIVIRTVFALMLSMVLSDGLYFPLQIFMMLMYGQILHIQARVFKDLLTLAGSEIRILEKGSRNHPLCAAATERNSIRSQFELD